MTDVHAVSPSIAIPAEADIDVYGRQQIAEVGAPQVDPAGVVGGYPFPWASEQPCDRGGTKIVQPLGGTSFRHVRPANIKPESTPEYHCSTGRYDTPKPHEMTIEATIRS